MIPTTSKLCRRCKTLNKPGSKFCKHCGESLSPPTPLRMQPESIRMRRTLGDRIGGGIAGIQPRAKPMRPIARSLFSGFHGFIEKKRMQVAARNIAYQKAYQAERLKLVRKKAREDARARGVAQTRQRVRIPF